MICSFAPSLQCMAGIIVVTVHSLYGPVVMVHLVAVMVHLSKSLWSTSQVVMGHLKMFECASKRFFKILFIYSLDLRQVGL